VSVRSRSKTSRDQQVGEQLTGLLAAFSQHLEIRRQRLQLLELHSSLDATQDGGALVLAEVMTRARADQGEDLVQDALLVRPQLVAVRGQRDARRPVGQALQLVGDDRERQHQVDHAGGDRAARHAVELGVLGRLHDRDAAGLLDPAQAQAAVGPRAGEHDADGLPVVRRRQRAEEVIDRRPLPRARLELRQAQVRVDRVEVRARRDDVHAVGRELRGLADLLHRHPAGGLEQLREVALVSGGQVHDDDEREAGVARQVGEQCAQRAQPAGRRADPDDPHG
jgi:hypothetical protein